MNKPLNKLESLSISAAEYIENNIKYTIYFKHAFLTWFFLTINMFSFHYNSIKISLCIKKICLLIIFVVAFYHYAR